VADAKPISILKLIAIPAVITLGVTILRLVGELKHWPTPWFNAAGGGGAAIVGISWLPIIFGPYFALKLAGAGAGPASAWKSIAYAFAALVVYVLGGFLFAMTISHPGGLTLLACLLMLAAAFVVFPGWRALGSALFADALAARIPVLIVMYLAMHGNGGAGWGTHYDAVPPVLAQAPLGAKYLYAGILPQLTLWIGWTCVVGAILGAIVAAIARRGKQTAPAGA
jgi:hypothetical protein